MKTLLTFLGFGTKAEVKTAHSYKSVTTAKGKYTKRNDGVEYFISSDLLD